MFVLPCSHWDVFGDPLTIPIQLLLQNYQLLATELEAQDHQTRPGDAVDGKGSGALSSRELTWSYLEQHFAISKLCPMAPQNLDSEVKQPDTPGHGQYSNSPPQEEQSPSGQKEAV